MRCFIAIEIPPFPMIAKLQDAIAGKVRFVDIKNMHLTLKFLGEINGNMVNKIKDIVGYCKPEQFRIKLNGIGFFPNDKHVKVIWVGISNPDMVIKLMHCIDEKLTPIGFKMENNHVPHITVARVKGKINTKKLDVFANVEFGEFIVERIKIKKSTLTTEGPVYSDLYEIPLSI